MKKCTTADKELAKIAKLKTTPEELLKQIEEIKARRKKRRLSSSRLNRHLEDILTLHYGMNSSCADIALWLRTHKRIKVTRQSVFNFIDKHVKSIKDEEGAEN